MSRTRSLGDGAANPGELSWGDRREQILTRYFALLADEGSPLLLAGPDVEAQVASQLLAVVDAAVGEFPDAVETELSADIGRARAASGVHPSVSLSAARLIFVAALPSVTEHMLAGGDTGAASTAAIRLNAAILSRMADAAANYISFLLDKVDQAHRDEAQRLSRDLHDLVGPTIAVAVQSLDLAGRYRRSQPERELEKLAAARKSLVDGGVVLRALAAETRVAFAPGGITAALTKCLENVPDQIHTQASMHGPLGTIPAHYEREVFLILREAIRNAVAHSSATEIFVSMAVDGIHLRCSVQDNGAGLRAAEPRSGTGMDSMRERAALLGADLQIASSKAGTQVHLTVPLPNRMQS